MPFSQLRQLRRARIVHARWALAAVAVVCGVSARAASAQVVLDSTTHQRFSIAPPLTGPHASAAIAGTSCTTDCTPLIYHGGPVQHGESDYLFFWLPSGYSFPSGYESGLQTWLNGVAAADGTSGNPFSVDTQYYDTSGPGESDSDVSYAVQDAGSIVDTDPYPSSACTDKDAEGNAQSMCLTDAEIQTEVSSYVAAHGLPTGLGVEYFVLTPQGVGSCFDSSSASGDCSYTGYCGYHSDMSVDSGTSEILYANLPWADDVPGCDVNMAFGAGYPNQGGIDPVVSVFSHELSETMTDPELSAWYDSSGNEIADKCAYTYDAGGYGSTSGLNWNGSGYWNVPLAGGDYLMQLEYDQRAGDCEAGLTTTWTGGAANTGWSQIASWAGALAPAGGVDTLVFPALRSGACTSDPATAACYVSNDTVSGLTANAITIDDGVGYSITGDALTLGAGGIDASTSSSSPTASAIDAPLALSAAQTWTVSGAAGGAGAGLTLGGAVSGSSDALQADLSGQATLNLSADDELGPVTVSGANSADSGSNAGENGTLSTTTSLNGTDGDPVALSDVAMVTGASTASGPVTSTGSSIQVGPGRAGALSVAGAVSLDPSSELTLFIGSGTTPGTDYSHLSATGAVSLSGALQLATGTAECPAIPQGQIDTLISTGGSLSGTFSGVPNGTVLTLPCGSGAPTVEINYTANSVTATAVSSAPSSLLAPAIAGLPEPGQSLTETPGEWSNAPTSVVDQWERCDATGANCSPIAGADTEQYALSAGDLGSTIRVEEVASNATGSTTAWSAPTAVIAVPSPPGSPPPTTGPGSGASPSPSPTPSPSPSPAAGTTASATTPGQTGPTGAQIRAALLEVLASAGKSSRVGQLRSTGSYSVSIPSPGAGEFVLSWALEPAKHGSRSHGKRAASPALVALGRAGYTRAGAFSLKIRLTPAGRRLLARRGMLTLSFTVTFTPAGSHQPVSVGRSLTIGR